MELRCSKSWSYNINPKAMPEQIIPNLQLHYLNGQEHGAPPVFKDVRLSRDANKDCEALIDLARQHDKRIRSENELNQVLEIQVSLRGCIAQLELLKRNEREPWVKILSQIDAAIVGEISQMRVLSAGLKARIEAYRQEEEQGRERERQRLEEEAKRKELEAEYADNPQRKRDAKVKAKQIRAEAKKFEPKPKPGLDTVEDYEIEIENRALAAKLPEDAIRMEVNEKWFKDKIREAKNNHQPIPTFSGIKITPHTRVRIHR